MKKASFPLFLLFVAVVTSGIYHSVRRDWVRFRQGEWALASRNYSDSLRSFEESWTLGLRAPVFLLKYQEAFLSMG